MDLYILSCCGIIYCYCCWFVCYFFQLFTSVYNLVSWTDSSLVRALKSCFHWILITQDLHRQLKWQLKRALYQGKKWLVYWNTTAHTIQYNRLCAYTPICVCLYGYIVYMYISNYTCILWWEIKWAHKYLM